MGERNVGKGWRPLRSGEQRQEGDQFWNAFERCWLPIVREALGAVYCEGEHPLHRRRVDAPTRRDPLGVVTLDKGVRHG